MNPISHLVLCIDDEPIRYRKLRKMVAETPMVLVTTCRHEDVNEYLQGPHQIVGVCLDHDMPQVSGAYFAGILREKNIPIVITSLNPEGARHIKFLLDEYETPNMILPCTTEGWEDRAVKFWYDVALDKGSDFLDGSYTEDPPMVEE